MYQALLTRRYLTSKLMPLLAALAVVLCTAMVLVVWSVMGGFLGMLLDTGRLLVGDVEITRPVTGMPYYEELIERLEADPEIKAATATVEGLALMGLEDGRTMAVKVIGVDGKGYDAVTGYGDTLWWRHLDQPNKKDVSREDLRLQLEPGYEDAGLMLTENNPFTGEPVAAAVPGIEATGETSRQTGGWYQSAYTEGLGVTLRRSESGDRWVMQSDGREYVIDKLPFTIDQSITLSMLPISGRGAAIDVQVRKIPIANEFRTGLYEVDQGIVLVRMDLVQEMLKLDRAVRVADSFSSGVTTNDDGSESFAEPEIIGEEPARATSVLIKGAPGVTDQRVKERCVAIYAQFFEAHPFEVPSPGQVRIDKWDERPSVAHLIGAVKTETSLVLALFGFISLTAVFLVFAIFWAMVSEKTKDIGILRSVGASRSGVGMIFISYGLVIGLVGAVLGVALAFLIVHNINPIHEWIGQVTGRYVWDPKVYYFTVIPNKVVLWQAALILVGGAVFSVLGSILPAAKAANMDPVRALRFE
ncbi:MAG: ABC transporter permease [Phycisphaeraceae bacterium]|nr:ABC transporter permease [Phycisphaeraceae bacterium]